LHLRKLKILGKRTIQSKLIQLILLPVLSSSQVLNVEQERIQTDTTGWSGNARIAFDLAKSQKEIFNLNGRAHVQFKTERRLILLLGDYGLIRAGGDEFMNSGFGHMRFNQKIEPWLAAEAFVQGQANKILGVRFRGLAGAGPRFRIVRRERFRLYAAVLGMAEYEQLLTAPLTRRTFRMSDYVSWTAQFGGALKIVNTTYWQPVVEDPADFRIASQTDFVLRLSRRFSYSLSHQYSYDSEPPRSIVSTAYSVRNVLSFDFGL
jgi:hypothetical protein